MVKRKKRLEKGIESLKKQITLHKDKKEEALEEGKLELAEYYTREIASIKKNVDRKRRLKKR